MPSASAEHDKRFMEHALELARKGIGLASPNPTVGCVIVKDGVIVGEGFHQYDGRDHAEIVALKQAGEKARGATLYVTLKSALTLDGQLSLPKPRKKKSREWITSEESRAEVHRMRHASDAVLTGIGTIIADDPLLTDRSGLERRRRLLRVVLDTRLRLSPKARIVKTADDDVLIFTAATLKSPKARKLQNAGVEVVHISRKRGGLDFDAVLKELGRRDILSAILEAGPGLNGTALASGAVNKLLLFYAPKIAGSLQVPFVKGGPFNSSRARVRSIRQIGPDVAMEVDL